MKVNIQKLSGGGFASFVPIKTAPLLQKTSTTGEQSKEAASSSGIVSQKMYEDLIGKGLINDVNSFMREVIAIESDPRNFTDSQNKAIGLRMIAKLNEIQQNKVLWDKTLTIAKEKGGLSEVAVGTSGEVYTKDKKGKIKPITIEQYKRTPTRLLTVGELLNEREVNPELTNNRSIFEVGKNAVGLSNITDHITELMKVLSEYSTESEKYVSKKQLIEEFGALQTSPPNAGTMSAMKELLEVIESPGDFYKIYSKEQSKRKNIDKALGYIWTTLGKDKQDKLRVVSVMNGKDNPKEMIVDMLLSYTEPTLSYKVTPIKEDAISGDAAKKPTSKSLSAFQLINKGLMPDPSVQFNFNDPKLNVMFKGTVGSKGKLVDQNDNAIGMVSLKAIFESGGYNRFLNTGEAYFGDKEISLYNQANVIYDPSATSGHVYLPVTTGDKVDWKSLEEFKDVYQVYEANKDIWSTEKAEKYFEEHNWDLQIDEINGEKIIRDNAFVKPFLLTYGYTNSATGLTKDNKYVSKLANTEKEEVKALLESIWTIQSGSKKINNTPDKGWHREQYYGGIITIPYEKNANTIIDAISGHGATDIVPQLGTVQARMRGAGFEQLNTNTSGLNLKNN